MYFKKCKSLLVENLVTPMPFFFASFFTSFKVPNLMVSA